MKSESRRTSRRSHSPWPRRCSCASQSGVPTTPVAWPRLFEKGQLKILTIGANGIRLTGLVVSDEKVAVLVVAAGLLLGNADQREDVGCLVEDGVHLLKRSVGGFRVEEVNGRENGKVDDGEDDVSLVLDVGECHRSDLAPAE